MLRFLLDWWSIGLVGSLLIAGAIVAFLRGWRTVAIVLAACASAHIYSGTLYQRGVADTRAEERAAADTERNRQATVAAAEKARLEAELATAALEDGTNQQRIADYEARLASANGLVCKLGDDDVRAINGR